MKTILFLCALQPLTASASTTFTDTWIVSSVIPDNDDAGYTNTQILGTSNVSVIEHLWVGMTFTNGWNGDLYAYLVHDRGFSVLLNRPGRSAATPNGSSSAGFTIGLDDLAPLDIHVGIPMNGGSVTGTFQPDGRTTDPLVVLDTDPRLATLSSFEGLDANGSWTLFVADQSPGSTSTLVSWSLRVTGVPEPGVALLGGLGLLAVLRRKRGVA